MHDIYISLNLCFNINIKFKFKLYSNYKDFAKQRYNTPYACNVI